ncbi:MAG: Uma2 family endonuclease, partial [Campylobacterota bacterium]
VEIISKSTAKKDEKYKFDIYEAQMVKYYIIVYPDDLIAKVYKNENAKFIKQGDFATEKYRFENTTCDVAIDFEMVFRRYRDTQ